MIRRVFWLGVGIAVGVVVVRKLTRTAESYTPRGLAASAQESAVGMLDSVREFMADVRTNMADREHQIHTALAENAESGELDPEDLESLPDPYWSGVDEPARPNGVAGGERREGDTHR